MRGLEGTKNNSEEMIRAEILENRLMPSNTVKCIYSKYGFRLQFLYGSHPSLLSSEGSIINGQLKAPASGLASLDQPDNIQGVLGKRSLKEIELFDCEGELLKSGEPEIHSSNDSVNSSSESNSDQNQQFKANKKKYKAGPFSILRIPHSRATQKQLLSHMSLTSEEKRSIMHLRNKSSVNCDTLEARKKLRFKDYLCSYIIEDGSVYSVLPLDSSTSTLETYHLSTIKYYRDDTNNYYRVQDYFKSLLSVTKKEKILLKAQTDRELMAILMPFLEMVLNEAERSKDGIFKTVPFAQIREKLLFFSTSFANSNTFISAKVGKNKPQLYLPSSQNNPPQKDPNPGEISLSPPPNTPKPMSPTPALTKPFKSIITSQIENLFTLPRVYAVIIAYLESLISQLDTCSCTLIGAAQQSMPSIQGSEQITTLPACVHRKIAKIPTLSLLLYCLKLFRALLPYFYNEQ